MRMKKLYLLNPLDNAHAEHTKKKVPRIIPQDS